MTLEEIRAFWRTAFPQVREGSVLTLNSAADGVAEVTLIPQHEHLRPGNIVSGPTMMMLADATAYAAILSLGEAGKMAVTSNLSIHFLKGGSADRGIVQKARVVKPGRRLIVVVTEAFDDADAMLAHATMTYAMPVS